MSHGTIYHAYVMLAAARNRGKITQKAVILVSPKKKRTPELCDQTVFCGSCEHPIDRTSEKMKKSSPDALHLGKGSSKDFLVEVRRIELLSEKATVRLSPSAVGVFTFPLPGAHRRAQGFSSFIMWPCGKA